MKSLGKFSYCSLGVCSIIAADFLNACPAIHTVTNPKIIGIKKLHFVILAVFLKLLTIALDSMWTTNKNKGNPMKINIPKNSPVAMKINK